MTAKPPKRRTPRARYSPQEIGRLRVAFLAALAGGGVGGIGLSPEGAARKAKVPYRTAYAWRAGDPEFAKQWDEAYQRGTDALKDEIGRVAMSGAKTTTLDAKGKVERVMVRQELQPLIRLLEIRENRPQRVELAGKDGGPLLAVDPQARYAAWLAMRAVLLGRDDMRPLSPIHTGHAAIPADKGAADAV